MQHTGDSGAEMSAPKISELCCWPTNKLYYHWLSLPAQAKEQFCVFLSSAPSQQLALWPTGTDEAKDKHNTNLKKNE